MQTLEHPDERAAGLYWLAFLITGNTESSIEVAVEALESQSEATPFFADWIATWSRKVVIAKALAAIRGELCASLLRTAAKRAAAPMQPLWKWTRGRSMTKVQLERALLAIDVFPRCALLLSVFEKMSLEDAAILLDGDLKLVRKAQMIGLRELTYNLSRVQSWTSGAGNCSVLTSEMQHA
ncbi:MAG TPA: hypothetical protein VGH38_10070 [Bryobacteraceae bacterium]|jgi:DNA-directed RNA polymerase specialized sigma24 family protein